MWSEEGGEQERRPPAEEGPAGGAQRSGATRWRRGRCATPPGARSPAAAAQARRRSARTPSLDRLRESPQLFAEVESVAQLGDRFLALAGHADLRRSEQPAPRGSPRPPGCAPCTGAGTAIPSRTDRDRRRRDGARRGSALRSVRCPPSDPRCARGPPRSSWRPAWRARRAQHAAMDDDEHEERDQRQRHPPRRKEARLDREPGRQQQDQHHGEARVGDRALESLPARRFGAPMVEAALVLGGRPGWHRLAVSRLLSKVERLPPRGTAPRPGSRPAEDVVAVRKAAEALDDLAVEAGPVQRVLGQPGPVGTGVADQGEKSSTERRWSARSSACSNGK